MNELNRKYVTGLGASRGVAIGKSFIYENEVNFNNPAKLPCLEATKTLIIKFDNQIVAFEKDNRKDEADVLQAYNLILQDPEILSQFETVDQNSVESVFNVFEETALLFQNMDDDYFKQRAEDILSVGKHLVFCMQQIDKSVSLESETILIASDLTPADTSSMELNKVNGIVLKEGGFTSHAVIVAKNLGIPCVIGVKDKLDSLESNKHLAIDGSTGEIYIDPTADDEKNLLNKQSEHKKIIDSFSKEKYETLGLTYRVNIGSNEEISSFEHPFLNSIGLFRSEFIYLDSETLPDLEQQTNVINNIGDKFSGTIVYRTLDIGGDKQVNYLNLPKEENPFLGVRGIRLSLANKSLFESQIKSILNSNCVDRIKIMFPMISTVPDFLESKDFVEKIASEMNIVSPPLGIMVETPSSVFLVDKFAEIVDFISIGTNDLTQYIMAADRGNSHLTKYQDSLSPAVLRAISKVIDTGSDNNIEVSVCGEMASDPISAFALYVLGLTTFSMSPSAAPFVFNKIVKNQNLDKSDLKYKILNASSYKEVREILNLETS